MEGKAYNDLANESLNQNQSEEKRLRNKTSATYSDRDQQSIKNS